MTDQDLTPSERRALGKLPRDRMPSDFLEERIARALRERGLLCTQRRRAMEWSPLRVAARMSAAAWVAR